MSNVLENDNLSTSSARKMTGIIDVHSHIITNLGSQAPGVFVSHGCEWNRGISLIAA